MQTTGKQQDAIVQQFWSLTPWLWGKHRLRRVVKTFVADALHRLTENEHDVEAWRCLALMTLKEPVLHLEILHRMLRLSPEDKSIQSAIEHYKSIPDAVLTRSQVASLPQ